MNKSGVNMLIRLGTGVNSREQAREQTRREQSMNRAEKAAGAGQAGRGK
jgi:hypothetical protein